MSHLLKRTKKSCIKLMRKISNKQIFLKRLEEEDISNDIDISQEANEKDINQNENQSPKNIVSCYKKQRKAENKAPAPEEASKDNTNKRKLSIHFEETNMDKAVLQSLTSKLFLTADGYEFRRLQQLRSDTASEIVPYDPQFDKHKDTVQEASSYNSDKKLEIVFEKVKYKEDVRYLRHTPSTSSLDNYVINNEDENEFIMMTTTAAKNTNNMNCLNAAKDFENITTTITSRGLEMHNNHYAHNTSNTTSTATTTFLHELRDHDQEFDTHTQHQLHQHQSLSQQTNHLLPVNVSLGCITDGNYHQLIIGEERNCFYKLTPVVKWDINGNSLEDDDFSDFNIDGNFSPSKSSLRSSSTTLETWLEVE